jgi:hypothetical protein
LSSQLRPLQEGCGSGSGDFVEASCTVVARGHDCGWERGLGREAKPNACRCSIEHSLVVLRRNKNAVRVCCVSVDAANGCTGRVDGHHKGLRARGPACARGAGDQGAWDRARVVQSNAIRYKRFAIRQRRDKLANSLAF